MRPGTEREADPLVAHVEQGRLRGTASDGVASFRGVPFAMPPTGARRWTAAVPPAGWQGERDATRFGASCPQIDSVADYFRRAARRLGQETSDTHRVGATSEDCLFLNIWTSLPLPSEPRPVFVWVHGGGGTAGSGNDPVFAGDHLVRRDLVVVTLNYRLGALGFLAHPALSADDPHGVSGNYAVTDVLQALRWVQQNIRAFGGDPARITLAGQSAGASLVELLMTAPAAQGLFHRAVSHSATWVTPPPLRHHKEASGETDGSAYIQHLGVDVRAASDLRSLSVKDLVDAGTRPGIQVPSIPVRDGRLFPGDPASRWAQGEYARVPLLKGSSDDEFALFVPPDPVQPDAYRRWVADSFGPLAGEVLQAYPPGGNAEETRRRRVRLMSADAFAAPTVLMLEWTRDRSPVWLYRFAWRPDDGAVGAFHGVDLPFLFGTLDAASWVPRASGTQRLSDTMQRAWAQFAAHGDPNGVGLPQWPRASLSAPARLVLDGQPTIDMMAHPQLLLRLGRKGLDASNP